LDFTSKYIVLEGIDGSGKTTISMELAKRISTENCKVTVVAEPFTPDIKSIIDTVYYSNFHNLDEILTVLFAADRLILKDYILRHLERGGCVVSDRSKYSSFAYQNVSIDYNVFVNQFMLEPDIIVYLDIPVELAMKRVNSFDIYENCVDLSECLKWYRNNLRNFAEDLNIQLVQIDIDEGKTPTDIVNEIFEKFEG